MLGNIDILSFISWMMNDEYVKNSVSKYSFYTDSTIKSFLVVWRSSTARKKEEINEGFLVMNVR
jgi:hypothetical protein